MLRNLLIASTTLAVLSSTGLADQNPRTLNEAIATAIANNDITKSTDAALEAIHYATLATKVANLPSGHLSCSAGWSSSESQSTIVTYSSGFSRQCGISFGVTIYDGGAHKAQYEAAKAYEEVNNNLYNTADQLTRNTRGGLAFTTLTAFMDLQSNRQQIAAFQFILDSLTSVENVTHDSTIQNTIQNWKDRLDKLLADDQLYVENFKFVVTLPPADQLEGLDATIASLSKEIPPTVEEATDKATSKGPAILQKNAEVIQAQQNLKALKASMGPQVTANASLSRGGYSEQFRIHTDDTYTNKTVGLTLTIPFNASNGYRRKEAESTVKSIELQRSSTISDAIEKVKMTYLKVANERREYAAMQTNFDQQKARIKGFVDHVSGSFDALRFLNEINNFEGLYFQVYSAQTKLVDHLYSIEQITGKVYDKKGNALQ